MTAVIESITDVTLVLLVSQHKDRLVCPCVGGLLSYQLLIPPYTLHPLPARQQQGQPQVAIATM